MELNYLLMITLILTIVRMDIPRADSRREWMPADPPENEEERVRAAMKYGLLPCDYKPAPEKEMRGDYPDVPKYYGDERSPWTDWDYPELRLNYGEPIMSRYHMYLVDKLNPNFEYPSGKKGYKHFDQSFSSRRVSFYLTVMWLSPLFVLGVAYFYCRKYLTVSPPTKEERYPRDVDAGWAYHIFDRRTGPPADHYRHHVVHHLRLDRAPAASEHSAPSQSH